MLHPPPDVPSMVLEITKTEVRSRKERSGDDGSGGKNEQSQRQPRLQAPRSLVLDLLIRASRLHARSRSRGPAPTGSKYKGCSGTRRDHPLRREKVCQTQEDERHQHDKRKEGRAIEYLCSRGLHPGTRPWEGHDWRPLPWDSRGRTVGLVFAFNVGTRIEGRKRLGRTSAPRSSRPCRIHRLHLEVDIGMFNHLWAVAHSRNVINIVYPRLVLPIGENLTQSKERVYPARDPSVPQTRPRKACLEMQVVLRGQGTSTLIRNPRILPQTIILLAKNQSMHSLRESEYRASETSRNYSPFEFRGFHVWHVQQDRVVNYD